MRVSRKYLDLTKGSIKQHFVRLVIPTIGGMLAFTIFNLTDTYFVSKLGTDSLAAMGFTFPIVMIVGSISSGMSIGSASVLSRAVGRKDEQMMKRTATDGIVLSIISVVIMSLIGLLTMDRVFTILGANEVTLPLVKEYMTIYYISIIAVVMPPVSDSAMRAVGDMVRPFIVMTTCALTNIILDPIFIFGWFGFPTMGIKGAALATAISRSIGMVATLSFLHFHHGLLDLKPVKIKTMIKSWKKILHVGVPGAVIRLFPQILRSILTALAATVGGTVAVAAIAVGTRVESFATVISGAVGTTIVPMTGQNFGADKFTRVEEVRIVKNLIAIFYGLFTFIVALFFAKPLISIFSNNPEVIKLATIYLRIILFASIGLNLYNWTGQELNAIGKPKWSLIINGIGTFVILVPSVYIGSMINGFVGMLLGLCFGQLILGGASINIGKKILKIESISN
ncbi:MAG: MATE family efflux transporter [Clostridia bacterium]